MGIPAYFSYLIKNHKNIIYRFNDTNVDNFYLDCNSIIYDYVNKNSFDNINQTIDEYENNIIINVINKIIEYVQIIKPQQYIYITFDGVPPIAKLKQQKTRRYKTFYQNMYFGNDKKWNTCAITPGSIFMNKLSEKIYNYFNNEYLYKNTKILLSCSDKSGEGEHKIYKFIRDNPDKHLNYTTYIYGIDADLFMLSLNHIMYCKNIYLYRETPEFIKSIDSTLEPNFNYTIDINILSLQIYNIINNKQIINSSDAINLNKYIQDYIFICFILGNDFMPHFPSINIRLNGIDILLNLYKQLFANNDKFLVKDSNIEFRNFKQYIESLSKNEENMLENVYKIRNKYDNTFKYKNCYENINNANISIKDRLDIYTILPCWERNIEKFININNECWQYRYYYSLFNCDINIENDIIKNICINYIETLEWTLKYYTIGCIDWQHFYKYDYPPLLIDLYKNLPYFNIEFITEKTKFKLHPISQLSYVLPRDSLNLLPDNIHNYLLKNYENHYRKDYKNVYAFCKYIWESHIIFPEINIEKFNNEINELMIQ
jgi:5'-3' exonuclease|tara:strand:- start:2086 stop:3720 length:1635 start_codon:yes stop_codon:yes gene_type:complete